jgi:ankyrin repeat protein
MSKYMHEYNTAICRSCGKNGCYEYDEGTDEMVRTADLKVCSACKSVQYCCAAHQKEDWPKHKKFCKRFRKLITEYKVVRDSRPRPSPKPAKPTPYPLHDLIELGDWQGLLQYLTNNPTHDVNGGGDTPDFMSPLLLACGQGQIECVDILLNRGANFTNEDGPSNLTPLIYASWWGHDDIVQLLLNKGADVNQTTTHSVFALGMAAQHLQPRVVELLLRYGADVDQRSAFLGWTALMNTVCMGSTDQPGGADDERSDAQRKEEDVPKIISIVKMLLTAGADINARGPSSFGVDDYEGDTALNLCGDDDKIEVVQLLIENGARLDVQRKSDGSNVLLAAAEHNDIGVVELLIRSGADTTVRDCNGRNYCDLLQLLWEGERISSSDVQRLKSVASIAGG